VNVTLFSFMMIAGAHHITVVIGVRLMLSATALNTASMAVSASLTLWGYTTASVSVALLVRI
jgi:hypothetical protein